MSNPGTVLGGAGLACGALALVVALSVSGPPDTAAPAGATTADVVALKDAVRVLERRVEQAARTRRDAPTPAAAAHVPPDLEERLARLEERAQSSEQAAAIDVSTSHANGEDVRAHDARAQDALAHDVRAQAIRALLASRSVSPDEIPELQRTAIDASAPVADRMHALRRLRGTSDGRSREVVIALAELARTTDDSDVRADIFRQLDGVAFMELRQPLLDALQSDADRKVREEAAETLEGYLDDPSVRAALELAAENDANRDVREQAAETLEGRKRRR